MSAVFDLSYPKILELFGNHLIADRLESRAFLGWFLENYYRLEEQEAQDAICDGPDDKGIDGVFVDRNHERIDVFQTKLNQNMSKSLGDSFLKSFAGTLDQFRDRESIERLTASTGNKELRGLIAGEGVADLIEAGYTVRGVFITNVKLDTSAEAYLPHRTDISALDGTYLSNNWVAPGTSALVSGAVSFQLDGLGYIQYRTPDAEVFIAPLLATDLIQLSGLESQELFDWNVRQALGRTKVNKAIAESVANQSEHKNFLLYHNGLTLLAESATLEGDQLVIDGYNVVNGCQSLSTLFEHRSQVTSELRLLTRVVKLSPDNELAAKITRHSNNQNAISARDLQSNSAIQRRLQKEFHDVSGENLGYEIKRGESLQTDRRITNEQAARLLLAFDLEQPWACHQSYRLFDELHSDIFGRPEVDAHRIALLFVMLESVQQCLPQLNDQYLAHYTLSQYFILYLLKKIIDDDPIGKEFIRNPRTIYQTLGPELLSGIFNEMLADIVIDLNAELDERTENGNPFDHKRELKSVTSVKSMSAELLRTHQKDVKRNRSRSFEDLLRSAKTTEVA